MLIISSNLKMLAKCLNKPVLKIQTLTTDFSHNAWPFRVIVTKVFKNLIIFQQIWGGEGQHFSSGTIFWLASNLHRDPVTLEFQSFGNGA
jgi:hypothetical protein